MRQYYLLKYYSTLHEICYIIQDLRMTMVTESEQMDNNKSGKKTNCEIIFRFFLYNEFEKRMKFE